MESDLLQCNPVLGLILSQIYIPTNRDVNGTLFFFSSNVSSYTALFPSNISDSSFFSIVFFSFASLFYCYTHKMLYFYLLQTCGGISTLTFAFSLFFVYSSSCFSLSRWCMDCLSLFYCYIHEILYFHLLLTCGGIIVARNLPSVKTLSKFSFAWNFAARALREHGLSVINPSSSNILYFRVSKYFHNLVLHGTLQPREIYNMVFISEKNVRPVLL